MTATPDGLNMAVLNSFRPARHDLASIRTRIAAHLEDNDGYVAFSGGKDSLVVLHLALRWSRMFPSSSSTRERSS